MGIFDGCLLACDIDGTLISDELLPERNVKAIERFVKEGGAFSLSTGRTVAAIGMITSKINCISLSVLSNGCVIYDLKNGKVIEEKCLPKSAVDMAKRVLAEESIGIEFHTADRVFVPSRSAASDLHEEYEEMRAEFADISACGDLRINKIIYFVENERQAGMLLKISKEYEGESTFYSTCTFINGVKQNYFEQLPAGVSKAGSVKTLCGILKIKKGGSFAIGDYYNDLPMIEAADISAVPAAAPDDVKAQATAVVCDAAEGAVADFIEYLEERLTNGKANKTRT